VSNQSEFDEKDIFGDIVDFETDERKDKQVQYEHICEVCKGALYIDVEVEREKVDYCQVAEEAVTRENMPLQYFNTYCPKCGCETRIGVLAQKILSISISCDWKLL
jgi:hypothetical protein